MKKVSCDICGTMIDKGDCNTNYMEIKEVDNRVLPVKRTRKIVCSDCAGYIRLSIKKLKGNLHNLF